MAKGIDYGRGLTNIDKDNGIRYGVLPSNDVLQAWADSSESVYPEPEPCDCETCGGTGEHADPDDAAASVECSDCDGSGKVEPDDDCMDCIEPIGFVYSGEGIQAETDSDCGDIFITKSPYYTRAAFCSPCAPGACYLRNFDPDGSKAYCLPADWFDDSEPCPYAVWEVATDRLVYAPGPMPIQESGKGSPIAQCEVSVDPTGAYWVGTVTLSDGRQASTRIDRAEGEESEGMESVIRAMWTDTPWRFELVNGGAA